jgi:mRNA interferase RelE/StbE
VTTYRVEIARRAVKVLAALPRREQQRIRAAIDLLAGEPRPPTTTKLVGEVRAYRVRVGDYRIVYEVFDDKLVVQVVRVRHRRDGYRPWVTLSAAAELA